MFLERVFNDLFLLRLSSVFRFGFLEVFCVFVEDDEKEFVDLNLIFNGFSVVEFVFLIIIFNKVNFNNSLYMCLCILIFILILIVNLKGVWG